MMRATCRSSFTTSRPDAWWDWTWTRWRACRGCRAPWASRTPQRTWRGRAGNVSASAGDFAWLSGEDATAVADNASGGNGCISVTANVAPAQCAAMQTACLEGDYRTALEYQDLLMPLHEALFAEPSPAGVKYAVSRLGLCSERCRLPMVPLSDATRSRVDQAMEKVAPKR